MVAVGFVAAGYADFPLMAYHFNKLSLVPDTWVPIFYAVAMGMDALAALVFGRLFDRLGLSVFIVAVLMSCLFAPLVFMGGFYMGLAGMCLWGVGMGAQESIMRATVASMVPHDRLGLAFGVLNAGFGSLWFLGSVAMGILYDISVGWLIVFSLVGQLISVPILLIVNKRLPSESLSLS